MLQIQQSDLLFHIKQELKATNVPTLLAMTRSGTKDRDDALDAVARRIAHRMDAWEILVPEGALNIFHDHPSDVLKAEDARRRAELAHRPRGAE